MTEEERVQRDAYLRDAMTWANTAPKRSLETRLAGLELDASAQRTAILKLERDVRSHRVALWVLAPYLAALALAVLT